MFWNKSKNNNETAIITIVTKTSSQAQYQRDIENKAKYQSRVCPECGHINVVNNISLPCTYQDTNINVLHSECEKCKAEWKTEYRL